MSPQTDTAAQTAEARELEARYMTPEQVATLYHTSSKTVTRWQQAGKLSPLYTPGGHRLFRRDQVEGLLSASRPPAYLTDAGDDELFGEEDLTEAPVVRKAVKRAPARKKASRPTSTPDNVSDISETTRIRNWARSNGFTVADRGRIPEDVRAAYNEAVAQVSNPSAQAVRAWAKTNGITVSDKGRVSEDVVHQYQQANTI